MINLLGCCYCLLQFYYSLCYQVLEHIDNNHMFFIPSVAKYRSKYNFKLAHIKKINKKCWIIYRIIFAYKKNQQKILNYFKIIFFAYSTKNFELFIKVLSYHYNI